MTLTGPLISFTSFYIPHLLLPITAAHSSYITAPGWSTLTALSYSDTFNFLNTSTIDNVTSSSNFTYGTNGQRAITFTFSNHYTVYQNVTRLQLPQASDSGNVLTAADGDTVTYSVGHSALLNLYRSAAIVCTVLTAVSFMVVWLTFVFSRVRVQYGDTAIEMRQRVDGVIVLEEQAVESTHRPFSVEGLRRALASRPPAGLRTGMKEGVGGNEDGPPRWVPSSSTHPPDYAISLRRLWCVTLLNHVVLVIAALIAIIAVGGTKAVAQKVKDGGVDQFVWYLVAIGVAAVVLTAPALGVLYRDVVRVMLMLKEMDASVDPLLWPRAVGVIPHAPLPDQQLMISV